MCKVRRNLDLGLHIVGVRSAVSTVRNLDFTSLDIASELVETRLGGASLPGRNAAVEDVVHFLESLPLGLRSGQEHLDRSAMDLSEEQREAYDLRG